ncbi:MAG: hypothetical protein ACRDI2_06175 [Chloroflexota bacterium]
MGALAVLGSLFLPWVSCAGVTYRGMDLAQQSGARQPDIQVLGQGTTLAWLVPFLALLILVLLLACLVRRPQDNGGLATAIVMCGGIGVVVSLVVIVSILYQKVTLGQSIVGRMVAPAISLRIGGFVALAGFAASVVGGLLEQALQEYDDG